MGILGTIRTRKPTNDGISIDPNLGAFTTGYTRGRGRTPERFTMPDLSIVVDGLKLPNPFIVASGPPGTNANVIGKAYDEGWGAVICKTVSLDAAKVVNVQPRYGRLRTAESKEIIGCENSELNSHRPVETWSEEFKDVKDKHRDRVR